MNLLPIEHELRAKIERRDAEIAALRQKLAEAERCGVRAFRKGQHVRLIPYAFVPVPQNECNAFGREGESGQWYPFVANLEWTLADCEELPPAEAQRLNAERLRAKGGT